MEDLDYLITHLQLCMSADAGAAAQFGLGWKQVVTHSKFM